MRQDLSTRLSGRTYSFSRVFKLPNLQTNADNVDTTDLYAQNFTFDSLPDYSDFTGLFDKYVIDSVQMEFLFPVMTQDSAADHVKFPKIYTVLDYDDSSTPVSLDELFQYQSLRECQFSVFKTKHSVMLRPRIARAVYNGISVIPAYEVASPSVWLDLSNTAVPHYGIKYAIEYNSVRKLDIEVRVRMNFRVGEVR